MKKNQLLSEIESVENHHLLRLESLNSGEAKKMKEQSNQQNLEQNPTSLEN